MNSIGIRSFAYFAVALMIASIFPMGAVAASGDDSVVNEKVMIQTKTVFLNNTTERVQAQVMAKTNASAGFAVQKTNMDQVRAMKDKQVRPELYRANYMSAKDNLLIAKARLQDGTLSANSDEMLDIGKTYMNSTIDYMITRLADHQDSLDEDSEEYDVIGDYISKLEQERENADAAQSRKELAEVSRSIREIWRDASDNMKQFRVHHIVGNIDRYLAKSETISTRIADEIQRLDLTGEETSDLEDLLDRYNELIEEIERNKELGLEAYEEGNDEAPKYLSETHSAIKEANDVLKDILKELKDRRQGFVKLAGTGSLVAEGNGTAVLSGDINVSITASNAKLVIKDLADDAQIEIDGDYVQIDTGSGSDVANPALVYLNFSGDVTISGSRLTVMVHGEDITLRAEGTGSAILSGTGYYEVEGADSSTGSLQWAAVSSTTDDSDDVNES
ncbi:MAG: hypothetical protein U9N13_04630, partial [Euryarchaeota archaeon]|nr:hypothetical protein [Euryarchaeota archaeon]